MAVVWLFKTPTSNYWGVKHLNNHEVNKPSIFLMSLTYLKLQEAAWRSG